MSEIFIVDDDPLVDTALAMALNSEGFNVVNFVEGESFLNVARLRAPDCVVIDTYLPALVRNRQNNFYIFAYYNRAFLATLNSNTFEVILLQRKLPPKPIE